VKIDIVGTGVTAGFYDWPDGHEKWSVGSAFPSYGSRIDLYFCFHDEPVDIFIKSEIGFFDKSSYPLDKVIRYFGSQYFTNSISYMLALAIKKKAKEINLWGVDCDATGEYAFERPSILYWIGQAEARGIKVTTSSGLSEPHFLYGYEDLSPLIKQLEMRRKHAELMAEKTEGREHDQWIGKMVAMRDTINITRS
jgi:hypothetical protein